MIQHDIRSPDEPEQKKSPKPTKAPSLDDTEAFPDAGFGSGTAAAVAAPAGGKSFASLAGEVLPEQKGACRRDPRTCRDMAAPTLLCVARCPRRRTLLPV